METCFSHHTELSPDELVIAAELDPYMASVRADNLLLRRIVVEQQKAIRLRNQHYAPGRFINYANRERFIKKEAA